MDFHSLNGSVYLLPPYPPVLEVPVEEAWELFLWVFQFQAWYSTNWEKVREASESPNTVRPLRHINKNMVRWMTYPPKPHRVRMTKSAILFCSATAVSQSTILNGD